MTGINFGGLQATALAVATLLVMVAAILIIVKVRSGTLREAGAILAGILIAALVIGIAPNLQIIGSWIVGLLTTWGGP